MKADSFFNVLAAAHLTYALDSIPSAFSQRGGIMLVGPPENMKTTIASCLVKYSNALVVGDLTVKQLVKVRDQISAGRYQTVVFPAFEKLYKRDADTASNVEGLIQAMTEEGFGHASFEDQETFVRYAKCLVVGAMVESVYRNYSVHWRDSGFARRFLWCHFILEDQHAITRAIYNWEPLQLSQGELPGIPSEPIKFDLTEKERRKIALLVSSQVGKSTPLVLAYKIVAVLKWRYAGQRDAASRAMAVFEDFAESLNMKTGAKLQLGVL